MSLEVSLKFGVLILSTIAIILGQLFAVLVLALDTVPMKDDSCLFVPFFVRFENPLSDAPQMKRNETLYAGPDRFFPLDAF